MPDPTPSSLTPEEKRIYKEYMGHSPKSPDDPYFVNVRIPYNVQFLLLPKRTQWLALNLYLHPTIQKRIYQLDDYFANENLYKNRSLHNTTQIEIANDALEKNMKMSSTFLERFLTNPVLCKEAQEILCRSDFFLYGLSRNTNLYPEIQNFLAEYGNPRTKEELCRNKCILPELQIKFTKNIRCQYNLAQNPNLTEEAQIELMCNLRWKPLAEQTQTLIALANNPSITNKVVNLLLAKNSPVIKKQLLSNGKLSNDEAKKLLEESYSNTPTTTYHSDVHHLDKLRRHIKRDDSIVNELEGLLQQPKTAQVNQVEEFIRLVFNERNSFRQKTSKMILTPQAQEILLNDTRSFVVAHLAGNLSITPEIQKKLLDTQNVLVLSRLAENPVITPETQKLLSRTDDQNVMHYLACNTSLAAEVQLELVKDNSMNVIYPLSQNPSLIPQLQHFFMSGKTFPKSLTSNRGLLPELQKRIAESDDWRTRLDLARNPNLTYETQQILMQWNDEELTKLLLSNPSLAPEIRKKLIEQDYKNVPQSTYHPDIHHLDKLRKHIKRDDSIVNELEGLLQQPKTAQTKLPPNLNTPNILKLLKHMQDGNPSSASTTILTPEEQLNIIRMEEDYYYKPGFMWFLAYNRKIIPEAQLEIIKYALSKIESHLACLYALSENPAICPEAQEQIFRFATDHNKTKPLTNLANNPSSTPEILTSVVNFRPDMLTKAIKNPHFPCEWQMQAVIDADKHGNNCTSIGIETRCEDVQKFIFEAATKSKSDKNKFYWWLNSLVANPYLHESVQYLIFNIENVPGIDAGTIANIKNKLAQNPALKPETKKLFIEKEQETSSSALYHPDIQTLDKLRKHVKRDDRIINELENLLTNKENTA